MVLKVAQFPSTAFFVGIYIISLYNQSDIGKTIYLWACECWEGGDQLIALIKSPHQDKGVTVAVITLHYKSYGHLCHGQAEDEDKGIGRDSFVVMGLEPEGADADLQPHQRKGIQGQNQVVHKHPDMEDSC